MTSAADITRETPGAPLAGRSVVVTRSPHQAGDLAALLREQGADVVLCPVIQIVDPPEPQRIAEAIARLGEYDWVVLTSTNAVERFFGDPAFEGMPGQALSTAGVKVAAVGQATAEQIESWGVRVDLVPLDFRGEGLVEEFVKMGAGEGWRLLVPRALKAREALRAGLEPLGVFIDVVPVYQTVPAEPDPGVIERLKGGAIDAATFTSPSTFNNFTAVLEKAGMTVEGALDGVVTASIGPVTSDAMRAGGVEPDVEAEPSTVPVLVESLSTYFAQHREGL